jgi:tripartite-type tricarboxylate transporter receptor subunit TctC
VLNWWGVGAPAKTPVAVVERLSAEIVRAMAKASSKERLLSEGADAATSTPTEFAAMLRNEIAQWARVAKAIGLKLD